MMCGCVCACVCVSLSGQSPFLATTKAWVGSQCPTDWHSGILALTIEQVEASLGYKNLTPMTGLKGLTSCPHTEKGRGCDDAQSGQRQKL